VLAGIAATIDIERLGSENGGGIEVDRCRIVQTDGSHVER
jgi:hypothetical protein